MKDVVHDLECEIENLQDENQELEKYVEHLETWLNEWKIGLEKPYNTTFREYHSTQDTLNAILFHIQNVKRGVVDD